MQKWTRSERANTVPLEARSPETQAEGGRPRRRAASRRRGAEGLAGLGERAEHRGEVVSTRGSQPEQAGLHPSPRRYQRLHQARVPGDTAEPQPSLPDADHDGRGPSCPSSGHPTRGQTQATGHKGRTSGSEPGNTPSNPAGRRAGRVLKEAGLADFAGAMDRGGAAPHVESRGPQDGAARLQGGGLPRNTDVAWAEPRVNRRLTLNSVA